MEEKRTKKEFIPYNDYQDRGMSLKWGTAFKLGELSRSIEQGAEESLRDIRQLPQMATEEIDYYLEGSIKYNKVLEIQLNSKDVFGRMKPLVVGNFRGIIEENKVLIGETIVDYEDIRFIIQHDYQKWSVLDNGFS